MVHAAAGTVGLAVPVKRADASSGTILIVVPPDQGARVCRGRVAAVWRTVAAQESERS